MYGETSAPGREYRVQIRHAAGHTEEIPAEVWANVWAEAGQ